MKLAISCCKRDLIFFRRNFLSKFESTYLPGILLCQKAKNFESEESQRRRFNQEYFSGLGQLLHDVYAILLPRPNDYKNRDHLIGFLDALAKEKIPSSGYGSHIANVEALGSYVMNMFTLSSDLDLSINFGSSGVEFPREQKIAILRKFSKALYALQCRGLVSGVSPVLRARVPVLKFKDCRTGIECDISIENVDGITRSGILRQISSIDERFRELCFLMKAWARAHEINSSRNQTLNSLSLIVLTAFHLQTRVPPIFPPFSVLFRDGIDYFRSANVAQGFRHFGAQNEESVSQLFVSLLIQLLSVETLWEKGLCASTYEGTWISKTWDSESYNMSVEDFLDRSQNLARSVGKPEMGKIYECIRRSLNHLAAFMKGKIQANKLKSLLFGTDMFPTLEKEFNKDSLVRAKRGWEFDNGDAPLKKARHSTDMVEVGGFPFLRPNHHNPWVPNMQNPIIPPNLSHGILPSAVPSMLPMPLHHGMAPNTVPPRPPMPLHHGMAPNTVPPRPPMPLHGMAPNTVPPRPPMPLHHGMAPNTVPPMPHMPLNHGMAPNTVSPMPSMPLHHGVAPNTVPPMPPMPLHHGMAPNTVPPMPPMPLHHGMAPNTVPPMPLHHGMAPSPAPPMFSMPQTFAVSLILALQHLLQGPPFPFDHR
ncbi:uncharacterized protein LOC18443303 isoform X3 [Amborella trichopoda]|uniref:uncharacterized protein LOC18443303 isoform X3 n=1 Tax=Amborella trichopoda TaxID=13333 RepID=UPI0009BF370F|nr:uncharacterized protein LOC18443303 isoform X3 [Amborella trichopoda]|eukprot:XP_020528507.1 uncharacterized protein LOC18443303 isoform X3 [Amborella trichopoda]